MSLGKVYVEVRSDDGPLKKGLTESERKVRTAANKMEAHLKTAFKVGFAAAAVGATAAIYAIQRVTRSTAELGDTFAKMAKRVGTTTEFLSGMSHAVELAGGSIQDFEAGMRRLSRSAYDFTRGLSTSIEAWDALRVKPIDAAGSLKTVEQLFFELIPAFNAMTSETEKLAIAQEIFGRGGAKLIPLMREGEDAIRGYLEEAKRFGIVWSADEARQAESFTDTMYRLRMAFQGMAKAIGLELMPYLETFIKNFIEYLINNRDRIKTGAINTITLIANAIKGLHIALTLLERHASLKYLAPGLYEIIKEKAYAPITGGVAEKPATSVNVEITKTRMDMLKAYSDQILKMKEDERELYLLRQSLGAETFDIMFANYDRAIDISKQWLENEQQNDQLMLATKQQTLGILMNLWSDAWAALIIDADNFGTSLVILMLKAVAQIAQIFGTLFILVGTGLTAVGSIFGISGGAAIAAGTALLAFSGAVTGLASVLETRAREKEIARAEAGGAQRVVAAQTATPTEQISAAEPRGTLTIYIDTLVGEESWVYNKLIPMINEGTKYKDVKLVASEVRS